MQALCKRYNLADIQSYTTRPQRFPGEQGHIFLSGMTIDEVKHQFPDRVAETVFDGHFYFATAQQVEKCDLYVVDPAGVDFLRQRYHGKKKIRVIYLRALTYLRRQRMADRGDKPEQIQARIVNDKSMFASAAEMAHITIYNENIDRAVNEAWGYISTEEAKR